MERVSDEWIARTLEIAERNSGKHEAVEILGRVLSKLLIEMQDHREAERRGRNRGRVFVLRKGKNMAQIKNAYIVYINFDGDIKSKYCLGTWLVFTELEEVKPVIAEALNDLMHHQEERDRTTTIEVGEYYAHIADVLKSDTLLEEYIAYGGSDMGNWEISIYKTFEEI